MADVHSPVIRSKNMSAIKGRDTKPELIIRKALHSQGFRYTLNNRSLPGKPDLLFSKYKAAIFVHGCFWHRHDCHLFKWPKTRQEFWREKINKNAANDLIKQKELMSNEWRIAVVWECALKGKRKLPLEKTVQILSQWIVSDKNNIEIHG